MEKTINGYFVRIYYLGARFQLRHCCETTRSGPSLKNLAIICWFAGILAQNLSIIENKINRVRGNLNYHDKLCSVQLRLGLIMVSFGKGMPKCHI